MNVNIEQLNDGDDTEASLRHLAAWHKTGHLKFNLKDYKNKSGTVGTCLLVHTVCKWYCHVAVFTQQTIHFYIFFFFIFFIFFFFFFVTRDVTYTAIIPRVR